MYGVWMYGYVGDSVDVWFVSVSVCTCFCVCFYLTMWMSVCRIKGQCR